MSPSKSIIANRSYKNLNYPTFKSSELTDIYNTFFANHEGYIELDIETNGLNEYSNEPLLLGLKSKNNYFCIIPNKCNKEDITNFFKLLQDNNKKFIGANIKFDIKFIYTKYNILLTKVFDIMIAEQRIWQKLDISHSYVNIVKRYIKEYDEDIDKSITKTFINRDADYYVPNETEIEYLFNDLKYLNPIAALQHKEIMENNQGNLVYKIEFPLIPIVAKAEATGFHFDIEKWKNNYKEAVEKRFHLECKMDAEIIKIREHLYEHGILNREEYLRIKGGKYDNERKKSHLYEFFDITGRPKGTDLFGNELTSKQVTGVKKKIDFYPNNLNYQSDYFIVTLFTYLKQDVPTKDGYYDRPYITDSGKIDKQGVSYSVGEEPLTKYKADYPKSILFDFITYLLEHRTLSNNINNFGANFEHKINPISGKIHGAFRQCRAVTGRFQAGGGRAEPEKINLQNIPGDIKYRNCFLARPNASIITSDYSGAELIVMCSLSQDMDLLEMSKGDMHSQIATKCWRAIYAHRRDSYAKMLVSRNSVFSHQELEDKINHYTDLALNFVVDKSPEKKHLRTGFKPITFGVIYGLREYGLSKYLKITEEESKIVIDVLKNTFPKVFKFVEKCAKFVQKNGYLVLNNRTYSKAYFNNVIKQLRGELTYQDSAAEIFKDINEARNMPIQGTQADFMKEASVRMQAYINHYNIDAVILSWVHDEIIVDCMNKDLYKDYVYTYYNGNKKTFKNFAEVKNEIMIDTANQYLNNVKIKTDYEIRPYWTK